ncbi:Homeodomain-like DNA binding domain-containing transcription factor [Phycomyces blakesleeanus]|uniref:Homeodomain-like DNA binding domain-containing transcription factor n=1 Tax=Phycomyces blakesleeanus TaxID=4837 RepID=A0ABR3AW50_PHYBL
MLDNMDIEYLSLNEQGDSDYLTREVTVSLVSMMRAKIEVFSNALTVKNNVKKESTYGSYDSDQISRFLSLVIEQVPVKDVAADAGITKSTAYRF